MKNRSLTALLVIALVAVSAQARARRFFMRSSPGPSLSFVVVCRTNRDRIAPGVIRSCRSFTWS